MAAVPSSGSSVTSRKRKTADRDATASTIDSDSSVVFGSFTVAKASPTPYSDATKCKKLVKHVKRPMNGECVLFRVFCKEIGNQGT